MFADPPRAFRQFIRAHNRRAAFLSCAAVVLGAIVWGLIYLGIVWLGTIFWTVTQSVNAEVPTSFLPIYMVVAGVLVLIHWITFGVMEYRPERADHLSAGKMILDCLLAPVSLVLAIPNNWRARVHPSADDLDAAWYLLQHLRDEQKIRLQELPLALPDARQLEAVQYLLGIVGLTEVDNYGGVWWLHLRNEQSRFVVRHWTRLMEQKKGDTGHIQGNA